MDEKRSWRQRIELKKRSRSLKKHARRVEGATTRHAHRFLISRWDRIREVRLHIILWMSGVGILIALVGLQMVWFQRSYVTRASVSGGTYAEAIRGPVQTLNPLFATTPAELSVSNLLFSSLYSTDETGSLKGDIAKSISVQDDKIYTVKMRRDAKWHDGEKLTADDVVYTVGLMKHPTVRSVMLASWKGIDVQKVDDYTVRFTLPAAYAVFPRALTFSILPQHVLKSDNLSSMREASFSSAPVGSGPFSIRLLQVVSQAKERKIVHMNANDDYYSGKPRLDRLQLHVYNTDEEEAMALKTGEVTGASDVSSDVAVGVDTSKYNVQVKSVNDGVYALFNLAQPLVRDQAVRKALQTGTDTNVIRNNIYGTPKALHLPFIPYQVVGSDAIAVPKYDAAAASKALTDAGWIMKDGIRVKGEEELRLRVVTRKNSDYEAALQTLVQQWSKLGVQVDTQIFDTSDGSQNFTTDILQQRNYDVLLDELAIGADPDVFAYWHSRGLLNFSNYSNETSDDDLASARTRSDHALRSVKYVAFARQWLKDVPAIGLYQSNYIYVSSKNTSAVQPDERIVSTDRHFANVMYWSANQDRVYRTP